MKKLLLFFLFSCTCGLSAYAQSIMFQKILKSGGFLSGAIQSADSGYVLNGHTEYYGAGNSDLYLLKFNKEGDVVWSKTYGETNSESSVSFVQTTDGGFAMMGTSASFGLAGSSAYVVRTDSLGNLLWSRWFGSSGERGTSIQQTSDGGFILGLQYTPSSVNNSYACMVKIDASGNILWHKSYSGNRSMLSVQATSDGGYVILGEGKASNPSSDFTYIVKTDSAGTLSWAKQYQYGGPQVLRQTQDGGYIIAANGLLRLDSLGNEIWAKTYANYIYSVEILSGGGYLAVGKLDTGTFLDALLLSVNDSGHVKWAKGYGPPEDEAGRVVFQTLDKGYFFGGTTYVFLGQSPRIYFVKTDSLGNSGCLQHDVHVVDTDRSSNATAFLTSLGTWPAFAMSVTSKVDSGAILQTLCTSVVSVKETENKATFLIYPNPAIDVLLIETPFRKHEQVQVVNVLGVTQDIPVRRNGGKIELNLQHVPAGFYMVNYTAEGISTTNKFYRSFQ